MPYARLPAGAGVIGAEVVGEGVVGAGVVGAGVVGAGVSSTISTQPCHKVGERRWKIKAVSDAFEGSDWLKMT